MMTEDEDRTSEDSAAARPARAATGQQAGEPAQTREDAPAPMTGPAMLASLRRARRRRVARAALIAIGATALVALAVIAALRATGGAREERALRAAEARYDAAVAALGGVEALPDELPVGPDAASDLASLSASATPALEEARRELDAAERAIAGTGEGEPRETYLRSLDEARLGVEGLQQLIAEVARVGDLLGRVTSARETAAEGERLVDEAVERANASRWDAAARSARAAVKSFDRAEDAFRSAHAFEPSAGLDKAAAYVVKEREEATLLVRMADLGRAGRVGEYNELVSRSEALRAQLAKMPQPALLADPGWVEEHLRPLSDAASEHLAAADRLRSDALEAFGEGR